jgi:hypothetical protein
VPRTRNDIWNRLTAPAPPPLLADAPECRDMIDYRVRKVDEPMGPWISVSAKNSIDALAQVANCPARLISPTYVPRLGAERFAQQRDPWQAWEVEETRLTPIINRLAVYAGRKADDPFRHAEMGRAANELIAVTGMLHDDAEVLVGAWMRTLNLPSYDAIGLHGEDPPVNDRHAYSKARLRNP